MSRRIVITLICIFVFSVIGAVVTYVSADDVEFNKSIEINEEKTISIDEVNQIKITSSTPDVNFILVDSTDIKAKLYGKVNCFLCNMSHEFEGSKLNNSINFNTKFKSYGISFSTDLKLDIYLPLTYSGNLSINTSTADVNIKNTILTKLSIDTSTGDIKASQLTLENGSFSTSTGDITLSEITVDNTTIIDTSTGDVKLNSVSSNVEFDISTGDIEADNHQGGFIGSTSTGDIDLHIISADFDIDVSSSTGDVTVNVNQDASFGFVTDTSTGDIKIQFEYYVNGPTKEDYVKGRVGESENNIDIKTSTGDITIK